MKDKTNSIALFPMAIVILAIVNLSNAETLTVVNTNDSGAGSLRQALVTANGTPDHDTIAFAIPGTGPHVITPTSTLPDLTYPTSIDGYTQPAASPADAADAAVLQIVLDGRISSGWTGLKIGNGVSDCVIRGLKIQGFANDGIAVEGDHSVVEGNLITECGLVGIYITGTDNTIGGLTPAQRNVVNKGNVGIGVFPCATHNRIQGNYIGTDEYGQSDDGFHGYEGIGIGGSYNTVVGNLISGYEGEIGVSIQKWGGQGNPVPEHNTVEDNKIGTDVSGTLLIPNGQGVLIDMAVYTTVKGNLIAGNRFAGVEVRNSPVLSNEEDFAIGNRITRNTIRDNGELGINLVRLPSDPGWVTENDPGDTDTGPNQLMNFPVIASAQATPGKLIVRGTIDTTDPETVILEFFANSSPDASGYGEGEIFLGTKRPNRKGKFTATLPRVSPGMWISATATDSQGNTSEFSLSVEASGK